MNKFTSFCESNPELSRDFPLHVASYISAKHLLFIYIVIQMMGKSSSMTRQRREINIQAFFEDSLLCLCI